MISTAFLKLSSDIYFIRQSQNFLLKALFSSVNGWALSLYPCHHIRLTLILIGWGLLRPPKPALSLSHPRARLPFSSVITTADSPDLTLGAWHSQAPNELPSLLLLTAHVNILPYFHTSVRSLWRGAKGWPPQKSDVLSRGLWKTNDC